MTLKCDKQNYYKDTKESLRCKINAKLQQSGTKLQRDGEQNQIYPKAALKRRLFACMLSLYTSTHQCCVWSCSGTHMSEVRGQAAPPPQ